jgi:multicomponent Na+:H+ antiporter subunit A
MLLLISIFAYFLAAGLLGLVGGRAPRLIAPLALAPFAFQLVATAALWGDGLETATLEWVPSLGLEIRIVAGELNLLLTMVVAGAGLLIAGYSIAYFTGAARQAKFLALMALFSGGMAGIVASDDLFGLFVFWEITTVASYLLIAFNDEDGAARASALQAILVTTAGGLAMLGGFVLLAIESGTSTISAIVADPPSSTATTVALGLVFVGAFTKSAQFPFHFWLPGAMAAPTPASAFLHSATMVKAGIVLLLFLAPGFAGEGIWEGAVTTVGLITMVVGAVGAMRRTDLKLLLAHGTVSQLGFMVALVGLNLVGPAVAVLVGHALFKAALFLIVGVVDKATGTRDIRLLSGLGREMPVAAVAGGVAAISMAGIPPAVGFVTKEAALDGLVAAGDWLPLVVISAASVLTVAYSARWWIGAFAVVETDDPASARPVSSGLLVGPVILTVLTVTVGLVPAPLQSAVSEAVGEKTKLVLWPGFKLALAISVLIVAIGAVVYWAQPRWERWAIVRRFPVHPRSRAERAYASSVRGLNVAADNVTGVVQNGSLPTYLAVILGAVLGVPAVAWLTGFRDGIALGLANSPAEVALVAVVIVGAVAATVAQRRMAAALLLGVVGYSVAGVFVVFGAPDLALTQVLIETLTIALFALVLVRLPRRFGADPRSLVRGTRLAISSFVGLFVVAAAVLASSVDHDRTIAEQYVELAPEAGGRNVVNVILTNFRALDTLGEITVLAAAAVGISVLVRHARRELIAEETPQ